MVRTLAVAAALFAVTAAVYAPVRNHELLSLDDGQYVVDNPILEGGFSWEGVKRAFTTPYLGNWIPLSYISLQLNRSLDGGSAAGILLGNAILHALATACLFLALLSMTGATWPSAFAAAVFGLHPLHVESVAWASERKDVVSGLFWMLSLWAHSAYAKHPSLARYLVSVAAVGLGLLSKPMLVTLPLVLLLLDYWPLGRLAPGAGEHGSRWPDPGRLGRAAVEKLPMLAIAAGVSLVTVWSQSSDRAVFPLHVLGVELRILNALLSYGSYLWDALVPTGLAAFYPHALDAISRPQVAASAVVLTAVTGLCVRFAATRPWWIVGWLWYLGTLVPVIGLVQVGMQARADRYTYLSLVGISLMVAWTGAEIASRGRAARISVAVAAAAAVVGMIVATSLQIPHWSDSEAIFTRTLDVTQNNDFAHAGLGFVLRDAGRKDEALAHFEEAIRINPHHAKARTAFGNALVERGDTAGAIHNLSRAARDAPDDAVGRGNLGILLAGEGRHAEARPHLERAVALRTRAGMGPSFRVHRALGDTLAALGDPSAALDSYEIALRDEPQAPQLRAQAGLAAQIIGQPQRAIVHYRVAHAAAPDFVDVANNLAWLLATCRETEVRNPEEAVRVIESVISEGSPPGLLDTQAASHAAVGDFERARRVAERAVEGAEAVGNEALAAQMREHADRFSAGEAISDRCSAPS